MPKNTNAQQAIDQAEQEHRELVSKQNAAYNAAWTYIREKYRTEYDERIDMEFEKRGLKRKKRSTPEERAHRQQAEKIEKATAQLDKLLAENPELKERLREEHGIGA